MMPTYNPYYHDCGEFSIRTGDNPYVHVMNKPVRFGDMSGTPWRDHYWTGPGQVCDEVLAGDTSEIIMTRALRFIEKQAKQQNPFFSCVWFNTPHSPIVAGNEINTISQEEKVAA